MSKDFKCEVCRKSAETLHMRNTDGKWVCEGCIPNAELALYPGLRRASKGAQRAAVKQKKAA